MIRLKNKSHDNNNKKYLLKDFKYNIHQNVIYIQSL